MNKYQVYWHRVLQLYIHQDETFCPLLLARYNFKWMGKGSAKKDLRCHLWIKFIFFPSPENNFFSSTYLLHKSFPSLSLPCTLPKHHSTISPEGAQSWWGCWQRTQGAGKERKERMPRKHSRVFIELLFSAVLGISTEVSGLSLQPPTRSASLLLLSSRSQRLSKWQIQDPKTNTRSWWLFKVTCSRW